MTVQELISRLERLPPELPVFVEGYESGWDLLIDVQQGPAIPKVPLTDWDGEVERVADEAGMSSSAVFLVGRRGHRRQGG